MVLCLKLRSSPLSPLVSLDGPGGLDSFPTETSYSLIHPGRGDKHHIRNPFGDTDKNRSVTIIDETFFPFVFSRRQSSSLRGS